MSDEPPRTQRPTRRWMSWGTWIVGVLGVLTALLVPFAPVLADETTVTWPQAGEQPAPTTAFFVPYAPAEVTAEIPCEVVRTAQDADAPTTVVSSALPGQSAKGFEVAGTAEDVRVLVGGHEIHRAPLPEGPCDVRLETTPERSVVSVGGQQVADSSQHVREISVFTTDLSPADAEGMSVQARTSTWFDSVPTPEKLGLIGVQLALAAAALTWLVVSDRRRGVFRTRPPRTRRPRPRWPRAGVDVVVVGALTMWAVLGPRTPDDGFTEGIVRNALETGAFTNYYRWENAAEAPFTLVLNLMSPLVAMEADPLTMRVPSTVAALATWLLISRGILPVVLPRHARSWWVRVVAAVSLLAWWMPFNLGVRPEPFVALGVTVALTCLLRGSVRERRPCLTLLGLGGLAAGLTIAVNPVGVTALAPVLLLAPTFWRALQNSGIGGQRPGTAAWATLTLIGCLGAVGVVAMFADQSLHGALRATDMHSFYGPNVSWFQEISRYEYLLGFDRAVPEQGGMGRRLPVLSTLALLACTVLLLARGAGRLPGMRRSFVPAGAFALGLVVLWLTPSKWSHYFGALAGLGATALTTAVVLVCVAARHWSRDRVVLGGGAFGTGAAVLATSLAFSGENEWFLYSSFGVPRDDGPFRPLNSPLFWALLVAAALAVPLLPRIRAVSVRGMLARMPALLAASTMILTVVVLLASFAVAPSRMWGSYSVGGQNVAHLTGTSCGIVDRLVTTRDAPDGVLQPAFGADELDGFVAEGGYPRTSPAPAPVGTGRAEYLWGSIEGDTRTTGSLTSRWFELDDVGARQELALSVAGRTGDGNRLALEFGRSSADEAPQPLGEHELDDAYKDSDERPKYPTQRDVEDRPQDNPAWRTLYVSSDEVPEEADRVRVRAVDATTDSGGWLATTGPRLRDIRPVQQFLRDRESVYVDWSMVWDAPCVRRSPEVGDGLAEAPRTLLIPPDRLGFSGVAAFARGAGGSFAAMDEVGTRTTIPTRLQGTEDKPEYEDWGELVTVSYPVQRDAYDTRTSRDPQWGWEGPRPPLGYSVE